MSKTRKCTTIKRYPNFKENCPKMAKKVLSLLLYFVYFVSDTGHVTHQIALFCSN